MEIDSPTSLRDCATHVPVTRRRPWLRWRRRRRQPGLLTAAVASPRIPACSRRPEANGPVDARDVLARCPAHSVPDWPCGLVCGDVWGSVKRRCCTGKNCLGRLEMENDVCVLLLRVFVLFLPRRGQIMGQMHLPILPQGQRKASKESACIASRRPPASEEGASGCGSLAGMAGVLAKNE